MGYAKSYLHQVVKVKIERPLGTKHPSYDFIYELNYGFIPGTIAPDGKEIDAYVLGITEPIDEFEGVCIAIIHRTNDNDDKVVIAPKWEEYSDEEIKRLTDFQEKFFESEIVR